MLYDTIIVGAGPSGLCAGHILTKSNKSVLVVDRGLPLEQRKDINEEDVSSGIGGAGLYSDGKLSFFPSATIMWDLQPNELLKEAYKIVSDLMHLFGISMMKWQEEWTISQLNSFNKENETKRKLYDSIYLDLHFRREFINFLTRSIGEENVLAGTEVVSVRKNGEFYQVQLSVQKEPVLCKTVLYAAGRYGAIDFKRIFDNYTDDNMYFRRYEIGVRVECDSKDFKPYKDEQTDYKYIENIGNGLEIRSFCCCRDGKVVQSRFNQIVSFNGSCDITCSSKSNIGVNLRVMDESEHPELTREVERITKGMCKPFNVSVDQFIHNYSDVFMGRNLDKYLRNAIQDILGSDISDSSVVYGPTIEGVGYYPILDNYRLKIPNEKIWVPGDCGGLFRGLLAALVSGVYTALDIEKELCSREKELYTKLNIKKSSTENMPMIFTAQSKVFFYCRDAICEYVLRQEKLPINPFRVFDYFLGDRVDRNIIRRGNNKLIQSCEELWVFGPIADGVLFEIAYAKELNIPIKYFHISTNSSEIHPIKLNEVVFESEVHAKQIKKTDLIHFLENELNSNNNVRYEQIQLLLGDF
jgi:uncharacterized FAD-dependent dehydrogenase